MKKRCRITPPSNNYKNGSVLRSIGAGAYGLGEGILDTVTMGLTDNLTDKGFSKLQEIGGASEEEIRAQQGIKGITNAAGAVGTAIVAPTMLKSAIGEATEGAAGALSATGNKALGMAGQGLTQATNMAMPFMSFKYGGPTDPPTKEKPVDKPKHETEHEAALKRQRIADKYYNEFNDPTKSLWKKKVYPGDPLYEKAWDPIKFYDSITKTGTDESYVVENYKPDYIFLNELGDPSFGSYPVFSKRFVPPASAPEPTNVEVSSLPLRGVSTTSGEIERKPLPSSNLHKEWNPYTNSYEIMSPAQGKMLSKEAYKLQNKNVKPSSDNMPTFDEDLYNELTMKPASTDEIINYKINNLKKYPEFGKNIETISQNLFKQKLNSTNKETMDNKKYGGNMFRHGGNIFANGGFGDNNMNEIPVTQFGNGGTHEENPLGGIPQGVGANGKQNLVEEGELKIPDPRPQSEGGFFIVSADPTMKITKAIAEQYDVPKKYIGKSVLKAAESILRKDSKREGDTIEQNSINIELTSFLDAHEELTAMKEAKEEGKFMEELAALEEKYPDYMQALMGAQEQPMDPSMQGMGQGMEQQMSPEEQAMMEQQMMAQQQGGMPQNMPQGAPEMEQGMDPAMMGMPPEAMGMTYGGRMFRYGGNIYENGGPGDPPKSSVFSDISKEVKVNPNWENQFFHFNPNKKQVKKTIGDRVKNFQDRVFDKYADLPEYRKITTEFANGGNMYGADANMFNPGGTGTALDQYALQVPKMNFENDIGLSDADKSFDKVNEFEFQKGIGNTMLEYAPAAANLALGLFGQEENYEGALGRMSPVELERIMAGQAAVDIDQSFAQSQDALQSAGAGAGSYLGNLGRMQTNKDASEAKLNTQLRNENANITSQEAQLNLNVDKQNLDAQGKEFLLGEQAEAARSAMLGKGIEQLGQMGTSGTQNDLAMMYNSMYAPNYNFKYQGNPFAGKFKK